MHLRHFFFSKICRNFGRKIRSCKIFDKSQVLALGAPGKAWVPKKTEEMRQIFVKKNHCQRHSGSESWVLLPK